MQMTFRQEAPEAPALRAIHRYIRAVTRHYASRRFAPQFSALMGYLLSPPDPFWMVSEPCGLAPSLMLNLSHPHQRKIYYFPKAWGKYWMTEPFPDFLRQVLKPGAMFIDIGAHLGFFSFHAAKLLGPEGMVLSFEPDPDCYASLVRSAPLNGPGHIACVNVALSNTSGEALFYRAKKPASSSLVPEKPGHTDRYGDAITVSCRTFDDYMKEVKLLAASCEASSTAGILVASDENRLEARSLTPQQAAEIALAVLFKGDLQRLQLIKCDVEGHEVEVVSGMLETLAAAAFPTLWIEVRGPEGSTRAPNTFPEVRRILSDLGYQPYLWVSGKYHPITNGGDLKRADVVFRHPDRRDV